MHISTFRQSLQSIIQENLNYHNSTKQNISDHISEVAQETSMGCFASSDPSKEDQISES